MVMKMATVRLSIQDRKDLQKFTKILALKAAQIIVQSRLGQKVQSKCKPHLSGTDWFNLAIQDLLEVHAEAKKALCGDLVNAHVPMCVEISLRTVEGDTMMLETWCLGVLPDQCDHSVRVSNSVYNRMCVLLKSLLSVTRVTPAYKLSRRQGPDSYVICYRIYMGEPQLHNLGEGYNQVRVGQLGTPVGTIRLTVSYRTKMIISPQNTGKDTSIMLKSDHFHPDLSPHHMHYEQREENNISLSETIKIGAFADIGKLLRQPAESDLVMPNIPFSSLLTSQHQSPYQNALPKQAPSQPKGVTNPEAGTAAEGEDDGNGNVTPRCASAVDSQCSSCSMVSANEDFIVVELKTPFAGNNANSDLGAFFRECQNAPQLKTFSEQPTLAEQVEDLTKTLEACESNLREYDNMLNSLCLNENNN